MNVIQEVRRRAVRAMMPMAIPVHVSGPLMQPRCCARGWQGLKRGNRKTYIG